MDLVNAGDTDDLATWPGPVARENPKETASRGKRPDCSAIPETLLALLAAVYECGPIKYARFNWREDAIRLSAYKWAATGHQQWAYAGEWTDDETGLPHLVHAIATLGILVDAELHGKLIHDMPTTDGVFRGVMDDVDAKVAAFEKVWKAKQAA